MNHLAPCYHDDFVALLQGQYAQETGPASVAAGLALELLVETGRSSGFLARPARPRLDGRPVGPRCPAYLEPLACDACA